MTRKYWAIRWALSIAVGLAVLTQIHLTSVAAPAAVDITGNWKGTLDTGSAKLRLLFKFSKSGTSGYTAVFDSLDQGAHDLPVESVHWAENKLYLDVALIKAIYDGTLDAGGKKFTGTWQQGTNRLALALVKVEGKDLESESETFSPADEAASKSAASKLGGTWTGSVAGGPASVRLVLKIQTAKAGTALGTLDSPDQGLSGIPLNAITLKGDKLRFEARGLNSVYEGTLAGEGGQITGQWRQGGESRSLEFKKAPAGS